MAATLESGHPPANYGLLAKERTVASPGYNRWLMPPSALAIHLCIGMAYGFSVFWKPLTKALGADPATCKGMGLMTELFTTSCNWTQDSLVTTFTIFIVVLGLSAALWGGWLERVGPRMAGFAAALCWSGGLAAGALGVYLHQLWIIWLGCGVLGGIGLGLGYISPVSTLVKWFPDRRGMATGMAIMGFGGGAMIGSPLADRLMKAFGTADHPGVWQALLVLAIVYFIYMMLGAFGYRIPASGWAPAGYVAPAADSNAMKTRDHVHLDRAWKTPQFWLIWLVLCMNVSAGIGVLALASPMLQELFGGNLIGVGNVPFSQLTTEQKAQIASIAAGFTGLLSLCNILGRFFWASLSDRLGRKLTYTTFFVLGMLLYASEPTLAHSANKPLFVGAVCIIMSMYGGGFATVPAYLADMFGTQMVGAIHGRLLTAWSVAGVVGPFFVKTLRSMQINAGVPAAQTYDYSLYVLAALLLIGLIANLMVRPVDRKYFMSEQELETVRRAAHERAQSNEARVGVATTSDNPAIGYVSWVLVLVPLIWGVWITLQVAAKLF